MSKITNTCRGLVNCLISTEVKNKKNKKVNLLYSVG